MTTAAKQKRLTAAYEAWAAKPKNAAYMALGPALIEKPLKYIGNRVNTRNKDGSWNIHPVYIVAQRHAMHGDGGVVRALARSL
jgi:hypothetical protein